MFLDINKLSIKIKSNDRELVKDLSFCVDKNDKIAIIGEEGNGKSTVLKCIVNDESLKNFAEVNGKISRFDSKIGYLPQIACDGFFDDSVMEFFAKEKPESQFDYEIFSNIYLIEQYFDKFGLDKNLIDDGRIVGTLSGGEKVKIAIIKILLGNPDVLVFDEPTNDVDLEFLMWFEDFLQSTEVSVLFVSHDETCLSHVANGIVHIEQLKKKTESKCTFVHMGYDEYIKHRSQALDKQAQVATFEKARLTEKEKRWNEIYNKVNHELNSVSRQDPHGARLLKKKMKSVKAQEKKLEKEKDNLTEMPDAEESIFLQFGGKILNKSRKICDFCIDELKIGDNVLAKNLKIFVGGEDKVAIVGRNGSGKTTLLKQILAKLKSDKDLKIGYMPQNYDEELSKFENVLDFALENSKSKEEQSRIRTFLGSLKFTKSESEGKISALSGGTKAKLYLAKIMAEGCNVLVLDEPTRNLSPLSNPVIRKALANFDGAIISVSHDRMFLSEVASKVLKLERNGLVDVTDVYKNV